MLNAYNFSFGTYVTTADTAASATALNVQSLTSDDILSGLVLKTFPFFLKDQPSHVNDGDKFEIQCNIYEIKTKR